MPPKEFKTSYYLMDEKCLKNLFDGKDCQVPIMLAKKRHDKNVTAGLDNSTVTFVDYEDDPLKDYLLFHLKDHKQAIVKYETKQSFIPLSNGVLLSAHVPEDIPDFLWQWKRGRFQECNPVPVGNREENITRFLPLSYINRAAEFRNLCNEFNVTCFIFGGSLLGWYRECSIIPHTYDFDFAVFRTEHSEALIKNLTDSKQFRLYWILGRLNDSLELTVKSDGRKIDMFYV
ncbi:Fukutin, partial [Aphelenchoides avenae]